MSDKGCEADIRPRRVNVAEVPSPDMIDPHLARRQFAIDALQAEGSMERDDLIGCPHRHGGNPPPKFVCQTQMALSKRVSVSPLAPIHTARHMPFDGLGRIGRHLGR
jgi:hypothetical protein